MQTIVVSHTRNCKIRKATNETLLTTPEKQGLTRCAILSAANLWCASEKAFGASMGMLWLTGNSNACLHISQTTLKVKVIPVKQLACKLFWFTVLEITISGKQQMKHYSLWTADKHWLPKCYNWGGLQCFNKDYLGFQNLPQSII